MTRDVGSLEPLELLYESSAPAASALTPPLARLYGGGLGFEGPTAYANFVTSVDGTVALPGVPESNALIAGGSEADRFVMGLLRALADVVVVGSGPGGEVFLLNKQDGIVRKLR